MKNLLDTSVLMNGKKIEGFITYPVLQELDKLKTSKGIEGKQARDAIKDILKNADKYPLIYQETGINQSVDDFLIKYAINNKLILHTFDLSLYLKAQSLNCESIFNDSKNQIEYIGLTYLSEEEYIKLLTGIYHNEYPINHFLIYKKQAFIVTANGIEEIKYNSIIGYGEDKIKPRNIEQYCLTELLERKIPVILNIGLYGSGKSFILLNYALGQLYSGKIKKLIIIPNNAELDETLELGILPGNIWEKMFPYTNILLDILPLAVIEKYLDEEKLEIIPMSVLRGRNISDSIIFVSESQNLHEEHIKLIIGRAAKGTQVLLDGDPLQTDKKIFSTKSGIRLLSRLSETKDADLFGMVKFKSVERSRVAQLAARLGELQNK